MIEHHIRILVKTITFYASVALLLFSCSKKGDDIHPQIKSEEPIVTSVATDISFNSAILWGFASPTELKIGVEIGIIVSTDENPTVENGTKLVSIELDKDNKFFVEARDLKTGTKYYYKAFLNVGGTYRVGEVKSFTTEVFEFAAVDLGLSVKWANTNLGASTPWESGDYYAWGEIEPKNDYSWATYKWCNWPSNTITNTIAVTNTLTKYNTSDTYGIVDNKTFLELADDVAHVKHGDNWRMPTNDEWGELVNRCTWTWTTVNGMNGYNITGRNGNSIFLPAAGGWIYSGFNYAGSRGAYWSSTLATFYPCTVYFVHFDGSGFPASYLDYAPRYDGFSIRPVSE